MKMVSQWLDFNVLSAAQGHYSKSVLHGHFCHSAGRCGHAGKGAGVWCLHDIHFSMSELA